MPDEKIAVTVKSVMLTEEAGMETYFVTLQDAAQRQMRVYIGKSEALALSLGLQGYAPERPQTYEAFLACLAAAGSVVEEICLSDLRSETFYATAALRVGKHSREVDLRPSDALNLAVRTHCPLFVGAAVFAASLAPEPAAAMPAKPLISVTAPPAEIGTLSAAEVSAELAQMFTEDQSDRRTKAWETIGPRDAARLARVKQLYHGQKLAVGLDYYHAAMVLQHSPDTEDTLLAHEFCIVAVSQGIEQAKWLAAASEDRFLNRIGRLQRFGTQHGTETGPDVEDSLRVALNVPTLLEAQARAAEVSVKLV